MTKLTWTFGPLSCSLMSLLASRTHEWESWTIAEGGEGELDPANVSWVELCVEQGGIARRVRSKDLRHDRAIEMLRAVTEASPAADEGWSQAWRADKFLSEIDRAALPKLDAASRWRLVRGSQIIPSLDLAET
ncbi:MAG TPA: hypothetical protein VM901_06670 [Bdellovibrionota bacterium]|jgi:hypothetical protein|nr:hypothetical protein [Bdellovibrionota bacterium]